MRTDPPGFGRPPRPTSGGRGGSRSPRPAHATASFWARIVRAAAARLIFWPPAHRHGNPGYRPTPSSFAGVAGAICSSTRIRPPGPTRHRPWTRARAAFQPVLLSVLARARVGLPGTGPAYLHLSFHGGHQLLKPADGRRRGRSQDLGTAGGVGMVDMGSHQRLLHVDVNRTFQVQPARLRCHAPEEDTQKQRAEAVFFPRVQEEDQHAKAGFPSDLASRRRKTSFPEMTTDARGPPGPGSCVAPPTRG